MRDKHEQTNITEAISGEALNSKLGDMQYGNLEKDLGSMSLSTVYEREVENLLNENDKLRLEILQLKETKDEKETAHLREIDETKQVNHIKVK